MGKISELIKENIRLIIGAIVVIVVLAVLITIIISKLSGAKAEIDGKSFSLMIARSAEQKQKGLSQRDKISDNQGMVFVFDKPDYYSFWMKGMKFSLDILFVENGKIVTLYKNVNPPKNGGAPSQIFQPDQASDRVIELNSGLSDRYGIKKGDSVKFSNL